MIGFLAGIHRPIGDRGQERVDVIGTNGGDWFVTDGAQEQSQRVGGVQHVGRGSQLLFELSEEH